MTDSLPPKALLGAPEPEKPVPAEVLVTVAKTFGVSPLKQFSHQIWRILGPKKTKLWSSEYYDYQVYRPELSKAERLEFLGRTSNRALNLSLCPPHALIHGGVVEQKALFSVLMKGLGLSMTKLQAVVSKAQSFGEIKTLSTTEDITAFLRNEAAYPVFGKPDHGSRSIGSALFASLDTNADQIILGNGQRYDVVELAEEIVSDYPSGYLFQDAVVQHEDMCAVAGKAVGTVRVLTYNDGSGPKILYTLWKIPSPNAMSDNFWQNGSMVAHVAADTGVVTRCRKGIGLKVEELEKHPVSGQPIVGFELPHWDAVRKLVTGTHRVFPGLGLIGWDVGISKDGPVIIEGNLNPFHTLYQIATGRGVNNREFAPVFERIKTRQAEQAKKLAATK